ncbi:polyprenyl synthetase family protein [Nocardia uniformis]|uniref:Polyprenyl synthetase family protein n=1 Tax=Nocardia uniformis TaxID=53432 RepID=A0A849BZJ5_9NOCA|nr:polyprenyl synthetase family protein [Nocardia uniformis]NNH71744.1 polyprenyl synthetase family protein [Nocardia uniformis]
MTTTAGARPMPDGQAARRILSRARQSTQPLLRRAVTALPEELQLMVGYHLGWWDRYGRPTAADTGKGLRPALVLAAATAVGGPPGSAAHAAAAVEMIHNFTLIHDDVMDGGTLRRGRPALWSLWGTDDAILAGDAMHALAVRILADAPFGAIESIRRLEGSVIELCLGQHFDCACETNSNITLEQCQMTLRHKGSALLGCACALGALCAGAESSVVDALDGFGRELGVAFQLTDDLIGIWGDPARTGKPVGNDLMRHKHSLPVMMALQSGTLAGRELADLFLTGKHKPLDSRAVAHATHLLERAGAREWARAESLRHIRAAKLYLPDLTGAGDLLDLTECIVNRDH